MDDVPSGRTGGEHAERHGRPRLHELHGRDLQHDHERRRVHRVDDVRAGPIHRRHRHDLAGPNVPGMRKRDVFQHEQRGDVHGLGHVCRRNLCDQYAARDKRSPVLELRRGNLLGRDQRRELHRVDELRRGPIREHCRQYRERPRLRGLRSRHVFGGRKRKRVQRVGHLRARAIRGVSAFNAGGVENSVGKITARPDRVLRCSLRGGLGHLRAMTTVLTPSLLASEMANATFDDRRLRRRLGLIAEELGRSPSSSLPQAFDDDAALEAA